VDSVTLADLVLLIRDQVVAAELEAAAVKWVEAVENHGLETQLLTQVAAEALTKMAEAVLVVLVAEALDLLVLVVHLETVLMV
jgi:hypothetical protein